MRTLTVLPMFAVLAVSLSACSDESGTTAPPESVDNGLEVSATQWRGVGPQTPPAPLLFGRFVSIGTSVTMGWQSDGVVGSGQRESWAVQLSARAARLMSVPYIGGFGCRAPLAAPLSSGLRTSGESAAANTSTLACAENKSFVRLPEQNVALAGATTLNALTTTPETQSDPSFLRMYDRVLPPGKTQVQAALSQDPLLIAVELGANEVLGARSGVAIPGVTMFPVSSWQPLYDNVVNTLADKVPYGVAFTLIKDAATFPAFRRGSELWADRGALAAAFHVAVQPDCQSSPNLLFVPVRIPTAVAQGAAAKAAGQPMVPLSCAGAPPTVQDYVLTPDELTVVNGQLAQMNAHIESRARARGWAIATLDALYGRANLKAPFSSVTLMTSQKPYGPFISLDGVHPSEAGHDLLADNVERALEIRYNIRLPLSRLIARLGDRDGHGRH